MNKPTRPFHFLQVWYPVALTVVLTCLSLGLIGLNVAGRLRGDFASQLRGRLDGGAGMMTVTGIPEARGLGPG